MRTPVELVVWDWNGTLLADQHVVLGALNAMLREKGLPDTTMDTYRALYTRPVRVFYERLFDRSIDDDEWEAIDDHFHAAYLDGVHTADLAHDAVHALDRVARRGVAQTLLSMARHDLLVPLVDRAGITDRFVRVDGNRGPGGIPKATTLVAHLEAVPFDVDPARVLLIGDAVDDAHAAAHVGARCVLYDGGSHPRQALEDAGVPVAESLTDALTLGGVLH